MIRPYGNAGGLIFRFMIQGHDALLLIVNFVQDATAPYQHVFQVDRAPFVGEDMFGQPFIISFIRPDQPLDQTVFMADNQVVAVERDPSVLKLFIPDDELPSADVDTIRNSASKGQLTGLSIVGAQAQ
ncbi:hypothetical protein D3C80_554180 [compost metagenome]